MRRACPHASLFSCLGGGGTGSSQAASPQTWLSVGTRFGVSGIPLTKKVPSPPSHRSNAIQGAVLSRSSMFGPLSDRAPLSSSSGPPFPLPKKCEDRPDSATLSSPSEQLDSLCVSTPNPSNSWCFLVHSCLVKYHWSGSQRVFSHTRQSKRSGPTVGRAHRGSKSASMLKENCSDVMQNSLAINCVSGSYECWTDSYLSMSSSINIELIGISRRFWQILSVIEPDRYYFCGHVYKCTCESRCLL